MQRFVGSVLVGLSLVVPWSALAAGDPAVLRRDALLDEEPARWVSLGHRVAAFGAHHGFVVADMNLGFVVRSRHSFASPVDEAVIGGSRLYAVVRQNEGDRLVALDLDEPNPETRLLSLDPEPRGCLHLAVMDDYLVVAEDGYGLRILSLPGHLHHPGMGHPAPDDLAQVGGLRLDVPVESVATTRRTIVVSTPDELWLVNAAVPALPTLSTKIPVSAAVSMAGNGDSVLMLDAGGVSRLDLSTGRVETVASGLTASGVYWAGRDIYLATDDGLQRYRDISPQGANFVVQVGDVFFDPAGAINVNVGDTVEWQKPATVFAHNVFSCNAAQTGCGGVASTEVFSSGTVTTAGFNFQHTFSTPGNNPYLCQAHTLSMQGDVVVAGGPASPPGVADGTDATTPMTVDRPVPAGTDLIVTFDTSCPEAADHNILVGRSSDLPSTLGGTYTPGSAQCDVGTASPFVWTTSPSPTPGDFVWWVLVADDGSGTEGSWGIDSAGTQRNGAAAGGASGLCTNTQKDLTNTCGQ